MAHVLDEDNADRPLSAGSSGPGPSPISITATPRAK